jgi:hypothetical protein
MGGVMTLWLLSCSPVLSSNVGERGDLRRHRSWALRRQPRMPALLILGSMLMLLPVSIKHSYYKLAVIQCLLEVFELCSISRRDLAAGTQQPGSRWRPG